jgi:TRAP-type C4-dicarboxylate transport system permease large subunit
MKNDLEDVKGEVAALASMVSMLVSALTPVQAAEMAVRLEIERQALLDNDYDDQTSEQAVASRNAMIGAYLQLLSAVARS